jgi:hypothetical protein
MKRSYGLAVALLSAVTKHSHGLAVALQSAGTKSSRAHAMVLQSVELQHACVLVAVLQTVVTRLAYAPAAVLLIDGKQRSCGPESAAMGRRYGPGEVVLCVAKKRWPVPVEALQHDGRLRVHDLEH